MKLYGSKTYQKDIEIASDADLSWNKLKGSKFLIAGATGLIGRFMIDLLMYKNRIEGLGIKVMALSRSEKNARANLCEDYFKSEYFHYKAFDISNPFNLEMDRGYDYCINLASNTHPMAYATRPVETIVSSVYGTKTLLDFCSSNKGCRFLLPSSVEIYGENRGDCEYFSEDYFGYLDSNTLRAGYPESKRVCESLCQAYIHEKETDAVIIRLPRIYGPTMIQNDSKALAQFIKKAAACEDIVLKSDGKQKYSFLYVPDAVTGILTVLTKGMCGEAYNAGDARSNITLKEAAMICAREGGSELKFELPNDVEKSGYSTATKAILDSSKLKEIGWSSNFTISEGISDTVSILRETM